MKKELTRKKINLVKETVANLDSKEMGNIQGGWSVSVKKTEAGQTTPPAGCF